MGIKTIEFNDAGLTVHGASGPELESPGYALINRDAVEVGEDAWKKARLDPRRIQNRFWDQLDLETLPQQAGGASTNADLAYAHLAAVWAQAGDGVEKVLLAVPGHYTRQQLGLLLAIARESGLPVGGMIDTAVAAAAGSSSGRTLLHLDLHLHRAVLTRLSQGARLSRVAVEDTEKTGLAGMRETWVASIAEAFLRATRFDPLHMGESEQATYEGLHGWLATASQRGSVTIELQAGGKTHSVSLSAENLGRAAAAHYAAIVELISAATRPGEPVTVLLSHRCANLPGLAASLDAMTELEMIALQPGAVGAGAADHAEYIFAASGESVGFVTHIPVEAGRAPMHAPDGDAPARAQPSHVLYAARAYTLGAEPLLIGTEVAADQRGVNLRGQVAGISRTHCVLMRRDGATIVEDRSTYGTFVNGARVEGTAVLGVGDRLRLGSPGQELQLIELVD